MDLVAAEAAQRHLWEFLELAAKESAPSDEGRRLLGEIRQAVSRLEEAYVSQSPSAPPEPKAEGPPSKELLAQPYRHTGRDNRFVAWFARVNSDMWTREPGDKLTSRQKADIVGQIVLMVFAVLVAIVGLTLLLSWGLDAFDNWHNKYLR